MRAFDAAVVVPPTLYVSRPATTSAGPAASRGVNGDLDRSATPVAPDGSSTRIALTVARPGAAADSARAPDLAQRRQLGCAPRLVAARVAAAVRAGARRASAAAARARRGVRGVHGRAGRRLRRRSARCAERRPTFRRPGIRMGTSWSSWRSTSGSRSATAGTSRLASTSSPAGSRSSPSPGRRDRLSTSRCSRTMWNGWPEMPASPGPSSNRGDALIFDELFLHQTGSDSGMTETRYAIECSILRSLGVSRRLRSDRRLTARSPACRSWPSARSYVHRAIG